MCALALAGCASDSPVATGAAVCDDRPDDPGATACAYVYGVVVGPGGERLDGIQGELRAAAACACRTPPFTVDEQGRFSITVRRYATLTDTATATVVVRASDARYPRHPTGGFYFDTANVVLRFAALGAPITTPVEVLLRIPLP